ncbi:MAG: PDZ domain-containing protein [Verrucomicrobiae bacterium]|nr:PDZ domain-containing protein [Verrucomicrobiae bacterium]NNJ43533.1 PDZ domain-containing protein [Akkermansiaceae bacterium]
MIRVKLHVSSITGTLMVVAALACGTSVGVAQKKGATNGGSSYYQDGGMRMFNPYPTDTGRSGKKSWLVRNFGPVGIGIKLQRPGMTMEVNNVEKGSPAEATGKLKKGQIIESINGIVLKEIDPRILLGDIITKAEATDGEINVKIKDLGNVLVKIPVMGTYSKTWPENCPKSDKIVRKLADLIAKDSKPQWGSVLFLLSTGEEKDLAVVRKWMKNIQTIGSMNWEKGYKGPGLCEYYLRTGDKSVLPVIKQMTEELKVHMYNGGWSGRGAPAAFTYSTGTGQVHASGMNCMTFLLMARLCGVEVDDYMFKESLQQFYRFAGHGNVAYGNGLPEGGFRDNGKTGGLAVAMAVAAKLTPEGESSVYAKARDNSAKKSFYATNWFHAAHTGGGIGEIWHHGAVNLVREKQPIPYRSYLDTRRWVMDLSRRFDGSIGIAGMNDRYDRSLTEASSGRAWGTYFALTYTYPRKYLQIWGAPRSKWAKSYALPARPWGNAADDIFQSPEPIPGGKLTMDDLLNERVETSASVGVLQKLNDPNLSDETLLKYIYHPEYGFRSVAMLQVVKRDRVDFVVPLLRSSDPRLREAGLLTLTGPFKGRAFSEDKVTPEMYDLVGAIVDDPKESYWVAKHAIEALNRAKPERIGKHRDRLLQFLDYDSVWVQTAAVVTLAKIATAPEHYKTVLPAILDTSASFTVDSASSSSTRAIANAMKSANPEVKNFAKALLKKIYAGMPGVLKDPYTGAVMNRGAKTVRSRIGGIVQQLPGGEEFVRMIPKMTLASYISGQNADLYRYSGKFTPNKDVVGRWAWCVWPQPKNPQEVDASIKQWLKPRLGKNPAKVKNPKDYIQLSDGGKVSKSKYFRGYFWSGDKLIGINDDQALKMEVKTVEGFDFLIVEKGGFDAKPDNDEIKGIPKGWHCGYSIYIRQK